MRKRKNQSKQVSNRRARHDYVLGDSLVVGMELTGKETKALRMGQGSLRGSYVTINNNQLFLVNSLISGPGNLHLEEAEQTRSRRLLAKRREIDELIAAKTQGLTIVPLEILTGGRYIKLKISTARGKKKYDKRQTLKRRDEERQIKSVIKSRVSR